MLSSTNYLVQRLCKSHLHIFCATPRPQIKTIKMECPRSFATRVEPQTFAEMEKMPSFSDGIKRPRRIILCRHGESLGNTQPSIMEQIPDYQVPLTSRGVQQARELGSRLKRLIKDDESVRYYVSPFWRTRQTYQAITTSFPIGLTHTMFEEVRLREQEVANFQNVEEIARVKAARSLFGHFYYRYPDGGESAADVYDRVSIFLESMFRSFDKDDVPDVIVIVAHGLLCRLFLMRWFKSTVEEFEAQVNLTHCEVLVMDRAQGQEGFVLKTPLKVWKDAKAEWERSLKTQ
jgi:broad specificity phosphatase PhoE